MLPNRNQKDTNHESQFTYAVTRDVNQKKENQRNLLEGYSAEGTFPQLNVKTILSALILCSGPLLSLYSGGLFLQEVMITTSIIVMLLLVKNINTNTTIITK